VGVWDLHPTSMHDNNNKELSSPEETRPEFNPGKSAIKFALGRIRPLVDSESMCTSTFTWWFAKLVGAIPKPAQRFTKEAFLAWAARLARPAVAGSMPSMIKLLLSPRRQARIGVRAVERTKATSQPKRKRSKRQCQPPTHQPIP
jgi:hypothetical protein